MPRTIVLVGIQHWHARVMATIRLISDAVMPLNESLRFRGCHYLLITDEECASNLISFLRS